MNDAWGFAWLLRLRRSTCPQHFPLVFCSGARRAILTNPRASVMAEGVRHKPLHGRVTEDHATFHQQNSRTAILHEKRF